MTCFSAIMKTATTNLCEMMRASIWDVSVNANYLFGFRVHDCICQTSPSTHARVRKHARARAHIHTHRKNSCHSPRSVHIRSHGHAYHKPHETEICMYVDIERQRGFASRPCTYDVNVKDWLPSRGCTWTHLFPHILSSVYVNIQCVDFWA